MYCAKCGKELADDALFCENCGAKVETEAAEEQEKSGAEIPVQQEEAAGTKAEAFKADASKKAQELKGKFDGLDNKKKLGLLGGAAVVLVLLCVFLFGGKSVNLSKYVTLKVEGCNGYGKASWDFDEERFEKDYGRKLKYSKKAEKYGAGLLDELMSPCDALAMSLSGSLDKDENLSNGDEVVFTWDEDDFKELEQVFNLKFQTKEKKIKVAGLEELADFDAFEGIEIEYEGCEPLARARVNTDHCPYAGELNYKIRESENQGLSNGDQVTVEITAYGDDVAAYCAEYLGKVPKSTSKEYTVEGLNAYVTSIDQIPAETLEKMKGEVEDSIRANAATEWKEKVSLEDMEYIGAYLLNLKPGRNGRNNTFILVYKVTAHEDFSADGVDNHFSYYTCGSFSDLMLLADGTCSVDLGAMSMDRNSFSRELEVADGWWSTTTLYYRGYEQLESLFNRNVTGNLESYTYTSTVKEEEAPAEETPAEETPAEETPEEETAAE